MNRNNNDRIGRAYGLFYKIDNGQIERHWNYDAYNSIEKVRAMAAIINKKHKGGAQVYPRRLTTSDHEVMTEKHKQYSSRWDAEVIGAEAA